MTRDVALRSVAVALIVVVPSIVLLGRAIWWLHTGHWLVVTIADLIGYLSSGAYAAMVVWIGEHESFGIDTVLYYLIDEVPTEAVSAAVGIVVYITMAIAGKSAVASGD
jgi:hypothetical protein